MTSRAATRADVAGLLGRAGFGATGADLAKWEGKPYAELVEHLVNVPPLDSRAPAADEERRAALEQSGRSGRAFQPAALVRQAQRWWLERMRTTQYPLEERLTLFWHDHFATSVRVPFPDVGMMLAQNQTLRRHALGNFRTLLASTTLDPAMLEWLDGARNSTPSPNENYARELLELFTMGTQPQLYSEADVREAARVLTGWTLESNSRVATFSAQRHDKGTKTVLGTEIANLADKEYLRLIDVALGQDITARFVAMKLVANFAYAPATVDLVADPDPLVDVVANTLRQSGWDLRQAMRALLLSDRFVAAADDTGAVHRLVRQPAEIAVAAAKTVGHGLDDDKVCDALSRMGQSLFVPPNVGGWPVGAHWVSPATALARYDFGLLSHQLWSARGAAIRPALPPSADLNAWATRLGLDKWSDTTATAATDYIATRRAAPEAERQAGLLVLLLSSPDWMVI